MKSDFVFTSASVTEGHPDKLCDQISDAIVDEYLRQDPLAHVVAECAVSTGILFLAAFFASEAVVDLPSVGRDIIRRVGYRRDSFDAESCSIMTSLNPLAQEGQLRRDETKLDDDQIEEIPAMDQVTVFGFACTQTAALMPLPIWLAHRLARHLTSVRLKGQLPYLAPDGKTQVAVEYRNHCPYRIHSIALNTATERDGTPDAHRLKDDLVATVIGPVFEEEGIKPDADTQIFVNPRGPLITGGPVVHSGLTGRKTAIDTYGEYSRHSEAALSGKSPSRIDRVGAYMARYAAKNVVMAGLAEECEVQVSYVIGQSRPVSIQVETFGTGRLTDEEITARVVRHFDFRPAAIVAQFNLRHLPATLRGGFYQRLAAYGHVGRMDIGLPWERTDKAELLGTEYGRTTSGGGIAAGR